MNDHITFAQEKTKEDLDLDEKRESLGASYQWVPPCSCFPEPEVGEPEVGPVYSHLGYAESLKDLRQILEQRFEVQDKALRIEKAKYCPREGTSILGCPIAKYVIRRKNFEEKFLVVVKNREGHKCEWQWIVMAIIKWDGIKAELADSIYEELKENLGPHGISLSRKCVANSKKTCACQVGLLTLEATSLAIRFYF